MTAELASVLLMTLSVPLGALPRARGARTAGATVLPAIAPGLVTGGLMVVAAVALLVRPRPGAGWAVLAGMLALAGVEVRALLRDRQPGRRAVWRSTITRIGCPLSMAVMALSTAWLAVAPRATAAAGGTHGMAMTGMVMSASQASGMTTMWPWQMGVVLVLLLAVLLVATYEYLLAASESSSPDLRCSGHGGVALGHCLMGVGMALPLLAMV